MRTSSKPSRWGSVALVSYVPAPLGALLDRLRYETSANGNPKAHVTLLPPRPLLAPLEVISCAIHNVLQSFQPFQVQFSDIHSFPETNVVYLDVDDGRSSLYALHQSLNTGVLAHAELFEYRPHLTLSHPLPTPLSEETRQKVACAWKEVAYPRTFCLEEAVLLWASPESEPSHWQPVWTRRLGVTAAAASAIHSSATHRT